MTEFWDREDVRKWLESVTDEMLPKMKESALSLAIFSGKVDAKLCVEIGAADSLGQADRADRHQG
jgi:hypothetical protein